MKRLLSLTIFCLINQGVYGNEKPTFVSDPIVYHSEFTLYQYQIVVSDTDFEDSLFFILEELPVWLSFSDLGNDTALLSGIADQYYETNQVIISVSDGIDTVSQEFNIQILCSNCGPEFTTEPLLGVDAGTEYYCVIRGADCEGDIVVSPEESPNWLSYDNTMNNQIILTGTPEQSDTGSHSVVLSAEREWQICPTSTQLTFDIIVKPINTNKVDNIFSFVPSIYPNPFQDKITICTNAIEDNKIVIEIISSDGSIVYSKRGCLNQGKETLNLANLLSGNYYLRILTEDESSIYKITKIGANKN